jgi:hypothetical protein
MLESDNGEMAFGQAKTFRLPEFDAVDIGLITGCQPDHMA